MTPQSSAEAIALAVKLSGHTHCQSAHYLRTAPPSYPPKPGKYFEICDGCLGDAATIDRELKLPERNAALLLAQEVCDLASDVDKHSSPILYECGLVSLSGNIDALREALKAL